MKHKHRVFEVKELIEKGYSQTDIAKAEGVTRQRIGAILHGNYYRHTHTGLRKKNCDWCLANKTIL